MEKKKERKDKKKAGESHQKGVEKEVGGSKGPEPTRYGDWELKGKCVDF